MKKLRFAGDYSILETSCWAFLKPIISIYPAMKLKSIIFILGISQLTLSLNAQILIECGTQGNPADPTSNPSQNCNNSAKIEDGILTLTDLWGRLLFQRKISDFEGLTSLTIPTEELTNGIYLVSVKDKSGRSLVKRLTITH
jgi:hypothetical protein